MATYDILMQFDIAADHETIHRALATTDGIASWWSRRVAGLEPPSSTRLDVSFPDVPQPFELDVVRDDADRVEWRIGGFPPPWAGTSIRWDLSPGPDGSGTKLNFSHRDFAPDNPVIPVVTATWAQIILRLKAHAETGTPQPFFDF